MWSVPKKESRALPMHRFTALLVTTLAACTTSADVRPPEPKPAVPLTAHDEEERADETRVVFAAVLCAYNDARARVDTAHVVQLDDELARIRGMFRAVAIEPRPCSDPLIRRLAGCIHVWPQANEILSEWREGAECSSGDVAHYK